VIDRLRFLAGTSAVLLTAPLAAEGQQAGKVYRLGFLGMASAVQFARQVGGMRQGLRELGYIEGQNLTIEYRWADGKYERLYGLAAELVGLKVDVIITHGTPGSRAAKQATATIPIAMAVVGNPDETGLVQSITRPGGNVTGTSFFMTELNAKQLQILKDAIPPLARLAVLTNPDNSAHTSALTAMKDMAQRLRLNFYIVEARKREDLRGALESAKTRAEALVVIDDGVFIYNAQTIADLASQHRLPTIGFRELADAGGSLAYGVNLPEAFRQSMALVDKILKRGDRRRQLAHHSSLPIRASDQPQDRQGAGPGDPALGAEAGG